MVTLSGSQLRLRVTIRLNYVTMATMDKDVVIHNYVYQYVTKQMVEIN